MYVAFLCIEMSCDCLLEFGSGNISFMQSLMNTDPIYKKGN